MKDRSSRTDRNKFVFKLDLNDYKKEAQMTSFGLEFLTEDEANENKRLRSVVLVCAVILRRGIVCELE